MLAHRLRLSCRVATRFDVGVRGDRSGGCGRAVESNRIIEQVVIAEKSYGRKL